MGIQRYTKVSGVSTGLQYAYSSNRHIEVNINYATKYKSKNNKNMKREDFVAATLMFIIMVVLFIMGAKPVHAQNFTVEGKTYVAKKSVNAKAKVEPIKTAFTYTDTKGNTYPIYMSSTGSCFVIKTSKSTGREYHNYLGVEISRDICSKLGVEYKGKVKGGNKNDK